MRPTLSTRADQKLVCFSRSFQSELFRGNVAHLLAFKKLPNAVGCDDRIPLVCRLHQKFVVLRFPEDALAGRVLGDDSYTQKK